MCKQPCLAFKRLTAVVVVPAVRECQLFGRGINARNYSFSIHHRFNILELPMGFDFWNEGIWLPENIEWSDLESRIVNGTYVYFPRFRDLGYSLLAGVILLCIRVFVECFVLLPVGVLGGWIKLQTEQSTFDICLRHLNFGFAASRSKFKRVSETGWRFVYYTTIWCIGIYVLKDQPQWIDLDDSWRDYPYHPIK